MRGWRGVVRALDIWCSTDVSAFLCSAPQGSRGKEGPHKIEKRKTKAKNTPAPTSVFRHAYYLFQAGRLEQLEIENERLRRENADLAEDKEKLQDEVSSIILVKNDVRGTWHSVTHPYASRSLVRWRFACTLILTDPHPCIHRIPVSGPHWWLRPMICAESCKRRRIC